LKGIFQLTREEVKGPGENYIMISFIMGPPGEGAEVL
jgi:hypothetical protein